MGKVQGHFLSKRRPSHLRVGPLVESLLPNSCSSRYSESYEATENLLILKFLGFTVSTV